MEVEAIFCGELTLLVFRSLAHLPIKPIWDLGVDRLLEVQPWTVLVGGFLGLCGAATAYLFATVHWISMEGISRLGLLDNRYAIRRALLGGAGIIILGMLIPHTMFWAEEEFPVLVTMRPANDLPFVWPTRGLIGFEVKTPWDAALVGLAKLLAISFTVAGGLRGGFIFPAFAAGGTLGRAFHGLLPEESPVTMQVCILSWAAGLNVGLTRTAMATTLILAFESGEPLIVPAVLMASLCSLFATTHIVSFL
jgi:H+/Cl- antiporter ClcA